MRRRSESPERVTPRRRAAADVDVVIAALAERTGVRAVAGGQHPEVGTHNAIVALGRKRFLEVIAPRSDSPTGRARAAARRDDDTAVDHVGLAHAERRRDGGAGEGRGVSDWTSGGTRMSVGRSDQG